MATEPCLECGTPFHSNHPLQVACSARCREKRKQKLNSARRSLARRSKIHSLSTDIQGSDLEPVTRSQAEGMWDNLWGMLFTPEEQVRLAFAEASKMGTGLTFKQGEVRL